MAVGLFAGLAFGILASATGSPTLLAAAEGVRPLGTLFVNAIRMVVIPLVMATVFVGVARLGDIRKVGRMGFLTMAFIAGTIIPAIVIGMAMMKLALGFAPEMAPLTAVEQARPELPGMVDFLVSLIPSNPFQAANAGALLPLIVFSVLFAAAASTIEASKRDLLVGIADAISDALIKLVYWVLWLGPIGVFGLAAPVTAQTGWALLGSLAAFVIAVILGLIVFLFVIYLPAVKVFGGVGPMDFLRGTVGTATVGFTTTSSVATLPVLFQEAKDNFGVSEPVTNFVLSLGAAINRAGSALYQGAGVVFVAALYDVPIASGAVLGAVVAVFFAALTVAPVPSASVMTLAPALDAVGAPLAGLAVLLGIDRIPDMFRTVINVMGHMAAAISVDGLMGNKKSGARDSAPERTG